MTSPIDRRGFLAGVAAAAWAAPLAPGNASADGDKPEFFFIVAADPQLFWGPIELWQKVIEHANRLKPPFMAVCGDLVQEAGNDEQARAYLRAAGKLDKSIRLCNVAGNHDVHARPTPASLAWYEGHFGEPWYSFTHGRCLFLVLESNLLNQPEGAPQEAEAQMAWLGQMLEAAGEKRFDHVIVFKHFPLCLGRVDEPDGYFNVPGPRRRELLSLFHKHGVRAVFSGHYHREAYAKDGDLELVTTSSSGKPLGKDPTGFRIVQVFRDRIEHRYYGFEEMPEKVGP